MKKTYFSPVTRRIDLSMELGCLGDLSQVPTGGGDENPDDNVDDESEVMTRRGGIWTWSDN